MVHSCLCRSVRAGVDLRFFARGVALRTGGGGLVGGRDTALGGCGALKVKCSIRTDVDYSRRISSSIWGSMLPPLMMATLNLVFES